MDKIVVLDFGSQYSHLICRRIRELNVYCELVPYNTPIKKIKDLEPKGIIFSGGPASVYSKNSPKPDKEIFELGVPILGICYGHQIIIDHFDGKIKRVPNREYGNALLTITNKTNLFKNIDADGLKCWMSHSDAAEIIPRGFEVLGKTSSSFSAAIGNSVKKIFGLQFHPEVAHTEKGDKVLFNFANVISEAKPEWSMSNFIETSINDIKMKVKNERVLCAVSGGIDSTTCAILIHRAIKDNLTCVFVDNGLLRENEREVVVDIFKEKLRIPLIIIDARERFLKNLEGLTDPEQKRKKVGEEFARVFTEFAENEGPFQWLAQGTLYPDVIESGVSGGPATVIKTHHNVGGLPDWLHLKILEPLRYLYKDEVRKVAKIMGIPHDLLTRHPFPGPGLAVRIVGETTREKINVVRKASKIVEDVLVEDNLYLKVWQAFAIVGDDKAVGILGDERIFGHIVSIRVVESVDAMTADWVRLPYSTLEKISSKITNEIENVTWITYAISSKPPSTIEPQ
ncbi:glutamine-hydrolyzing GMP synthase [Candidatus Nitrosocosmicus arcticus]|uniref:GMP synthase [glutamine-hydrolyzing] n=1 Tax=Candidatus Nitrosocosmicus arcticus TaxID=2035267 RepID=A0A557SSC7_9ARCH|nr:glutamine-hydrolyzing GMP synthase [Candidatus Nitrosocosmicus arcticus]TVP39510.1 GMP synthase [glutamine-hydrolyzing] [Candidatus Nitrosocosmicus arcticus]